MKSSTTLTLCTMNFKLSSASLRAHINSAARVQARVFMSSLCSCALQELQLVEAEPHNFAPAEWPINIVDYEVHKTVAARES